MKSKNPPTAPPTPEPVLTGTARTGAALNAALARQAAATARVANIEANATDGIVDGPALAAAEAECRLFTKTVATLRDAHATETAAEKCCEDEAWALAQVPILLGHDVQVADSMDEVARAIDVLKSTIPLGTARSRWWPRGAMDGTPTGLWSTPLALASRGTAESASTTASTATTRLGCSPV